MGGIFFGHVIYAFLVPSQITDRDGMCVGYRSYSERKKTCSSVGYTSSFNTNSEKCIHLKFDILSTSSHYGAPTFNFQCYGRQHSNVLFFINKQHFRQSVAMRWVKNKFHPLYPTDSEEILSDIREDKAVTTLLNTSIHLCFSFLLLWLVHREVSFYSVFTIPRWKILYKKHSNCK